MTVQVGHLYKKRILKDLNGNIREWRDDTDGGLIIHNYQVVNQEKYDAEMKKVEDKKLAAQAQQHAITPDQQVAEQRADKPGKIEELEKKVEGMESDIKEILNLLKK